MKYECEYKYTNRFYPEHMWKVVSARMGIHLHITDLGEKNTAMRYSGGIECHWRSPPDHMKDEVPHKNCWVLGGVCWHDGSSMQATEHWIPLWLLAPNDHDEMFRLLQNALEEQEMT